MNFGIKDHWDPLTENRLGLVFFFRKSTMCRWIINMKIETFSVSAN